MFLTDMVLGPNVSSIFKAQCANVCVYIHNVFVFCTFHNLLHNMLLLFAAYLKSNGNIHKNVVISDYSFQLLLYNSPGKNFTPSMCLQSPLVISISSDLSLHPLTFPNLSGLSRKHETPISIFPKAPAQFLSIFFAPTVTYFPTCSHHGLGLPFGHFPSEPCVGLLPSGHINCHWFFLFMP